MLVYGPAQLVRCTSPRTGNQVSLTETLVSAIAERVRRADIPTWQKAQDVAELQSFLRSKRCPHSTRELGRLIQLPQTRVAELLTIATELSPEALDRYGVTPEDLKLVEHRALLRIAKLPSYLRDKPLRDAMKGSPTLDAVQRGIEVRERRRAEVFTHLKEQGEFLLEIPQPITTLSPRHAKDFLDELLPAFAHLAEIVKGTKRSHYIGLAGNGGIVIYLAPAK